MKKFPLLLALMLLSSSLPAEVRIAVLGVSSDMDLIERWAAAEGAPVKETAESRSFRVDGLDALILAPKPGATLSLVASTLYQADVAIIAMDTTQGPLPVNRGHIIVSRQADVPVIAIMMANVDQLYSLVPQDAGEFLDIEEAEIRDTLALYEVGGHDSLLFHDSEKRVNAPRSAAGGLRDAASVISKLDASRTAQSQVEVQRGAQGQVYFLADAEAGGHGVSISKSAQMEMWSAGSSAPVEIVTGNPIGPGDFANVSIRSSGAFNGRAGSRMFLIKNGHVVGLGVLTEVSGY